jgi:rhodanese-related sulfurtransferase
VCSSDLGDHSPCHGDPISMMRPAPLARRLRTKETPMETLRTKGIKQLLESAHRVVPRINPQEAREMMAQARTLVVDVRDAPEIEATGMIAGAINVSRGMLEFRADPMSPYHDKAFDGSKTIILYCASGGRSALGGKALKDLGYSKVLNLGSFKDWAESGGAIDKPAARVLS